MWRGAFAKLGTQQNPELKMRLLAALLFLAMSFVDSSASDRRLELKGGVIELIITGDALVVDDDIVEAWARKSSEAVSAYFGTFPIAKLRLIVTGQAGKGVLHGYTEPRRPVTVSISVGTRSTTDNLMIDDWIMVHELIHSGLPWLPRAHSWFHEGVAVYVESVARVQAGYLRQETVLEDFIRQMPRGAAAPGGFDDSESWAKTYWGGALFCLLADVEIHRLTNNQKGLRDALRAVNAMGNYGTDATLGSVLAAGDRGTGTTVLQDLYAKLALQPITVDLSSVWRRLGVGLDGERVILNEAAPDASIRNSIFAP